jgi:hypothetical protein
MFEQTYDVQADSIISTQLITHPNDGHDGGIFKETKQII